MRFKKDLFDSEMKAETLRNLGISKALESAEKKSPGWNDTAFLALKDFVRRRRTPFLIEEVREWAREVPNPPSKRAWGAVAVRAARAGIIEKAGFMLTTSPKSHRTPATLWQAL